MLAARHPCAWPRASRATALAVLATLGAISLAACGGSSNNGPSAPGSAASVPPALSTTATHTEAPAASATTHAAANRPKPPTSVSGAAVAQTTSSAAPASTTTHASSPPVHAPTNAGTGTPEHRGGRPAARFSAKAKQQYVEFTRCMRAHGVNLPEPDFSGGPVYNTTHVNTKAPGFTSAVSVCRAQLVAASR